MNSRVALEPVSNHLTLEYIRMTSFHKLKPERVCVTFTCIRSDHYTRGKLSYVKITRPVFLSQELNCLVVLGVTYVLNNNSLNADSDTLYARNSRTSQLRTFLGLYQWPILIHDTNQNFATIFMRSIQNAPVCDCGCLSGGNLLFSASTIK